MAIIYTYPTKATPADADLILISDSADSNKTKQVTVASIKGQTAGVTSIIGGNNITISSTGAGGTGDVTVEAAGGGGTPDTPTNSVQFNEAGAFGGSENFKYTDSNRTLTIGEQDVNVGIINIAGGQNGGAGELKFGDNGASGGTVTLKGGDDVSTNYTITLPGDGPSANNKILESDTNGNLSWITTPASTAPQGDDGQYQYKNGSSFLGSDSLRFQTGKIHIGKGGGSATRGQLVMHGDGSNASDIQLYNSANNRFLRLAQQAGATQDLTLTFPGVASGGNNKILESDSSGQLSWIDTPTGATYSAGTGLALNGTTFSLAAEAGTWTPAPWTYSGSGPTVVSANGTYSIVGDICHITFQIIVTGSSSSNAAMILDGLPALAQGDASSGEQSAGLLFVNTDSNTYDAIPSMFYVSGDKLTMVVQGGSKNSLTAPYGLKAQDVVANWYRPSAGSGITLKGSATYKLA
jgi:hypothetical protein